MKRRIIITTASIFFLGLVLGCAVWQAAGRQDQSCTKQLFAMDTYMTFTAYGRRCEEAVDAAAAEVQRLDALLSTGSASSEVSKINAAGGGELSGDAGAVLKEAAHIYDTTGGLFDFTICPLMELWGFQGKNYRVPGKEEIKEVLPLVDASKVRYDEKTVHLGEGQQIDFGGIAKGYASARVMEIYQEYGIASGMASLGGNIQVLNTKPDGSKWNIGVQDPEGAQGETAAVLAVENKAVITSGGYERYFEEDGKRYIHILDPRTGYPADQDLASVTVVSENGTLADALSTSLYIMGLDGAAAYWRSSREMFDMVLITDDGDIYATEGISGDLQTEGAVSVLRLEER